MVKTKTKTVAVPVEVIDRRTRPHLDDLVAFDRTLAWLARTCYVQAMIDMVQMMQDMPERVKAIAAGGAPPGPEGDG